MKVPKFDGAFEICISNYCIGMFKAKNDVSIWSWMILVVLIIITAVLLIILLLPERAEEIKNFFVSNVRKDNCDGSSVPGKETKNIQPNQDISVNDRPNDSKEGNNNNNDMQNSTDNMIGKYSHEEVNADDMKTEETASIIKEEDKEQVLKSESLTTNEQKPKRSEDKVTKKKPNRSPFNDNYMYSFSDIKNMTLKSKKLPTNSRISESRETPLNKEEKIENDFKETSLAPKRKYSQNERGIREPMAINTKTQSTDLRKSETIEKSNLEVSENAKLLNDLKEPSSIPKEESSQIIREIKEPMARITKTQSNDLRKSETMEKSNLEVSENAKLLNDLKETSSIPKEESSQIIREIKEPMARITKTQSNDLRKSDTSNLNVSRNTNLQNGLLKTSSIPKRESTQSRRETEEPMTGLAKMQSTEMRKSETRELSNLKASEDVNLQNDGKETSLSTEKKHSENKKAAEEPVTRITPFGWVTDNINEERSSDSDIDAK